MHTKNKKVNVYLAFIIIFFIYLLAANKLVLFMLDSDGLEEDKFDVYNEKNEVIFSLDAVENPDNLAETLTLRGWAFCETMRANNGKEIVLILKSYDKSYSILPSITERKDVFDVYCSTKSIYGNNNGFRATVSTIGLNSGVYDLYIFCKENDENYGIVNTGIRFRKQGVKISLV